MMNQIVTNNYFARASTSEVMDIIDELQSQYPNAKINIKAYGKILSEFPQWAVSQAVNDLLLGKVAGVDASFCPPAPKIAQVAHAIREDRAKQIGEKRRRDKQAEEQRAEKKPLTEEQKERRDELISKLVGSLHASNDKAKARQELADKEEAISRAARRREILEASKQKKEAIEKDSDK